MYKNYHFDENGRLKRDGFGDDPDMKGGCLSCILCWVFTIAVLLIMAALSSCSSQRTVVVETVRTDTVQVTRLQRDSIFLRDSIHVSEKQKGDTVWMEVDRWHTLYRDRWKHDSVYISKTDSVPVPYPVPEYVERKLSRWQRLRLWLGNVALLVILAAVGYGALRLWMKK